MTVRIVHVADFSGPRTGANRAAMHALARQYRARGHEPMLVVPGPASAVTWRDGVPVVEVPASLVPGLVRPTAVERVLDRLAPDRLELSDRTSLTRLGDWARTAGVPSVLWLHQPVDDALRATLSGRGTGTPTPAVSRGLRRVADWHNARTLPRFDRLVATTALAADEALRLRTRQGIPGAVPPLHRVPLGVDLETFGPDRYDRRVRTELAPDGEALVLVVGRPSRGQRGDLAIDAVARLRASGRAARLVVTGAGPLADSLEALAARLGVPARLLPSTPDGDRLACLLACADVVLAGPTETHGLAALEALASGTPVVAPTTSALPEAVGAAGAVAAPTPDAIARALHEVLERPVAARRTVARARAELFPWSAAGDAMLALHGAAPVGAGAAG